MLTSSFTRGARHGKFRSIQQPSRAVEQRQIAKSGRRANGIFYRGLFFLEALELVELSLRLAQARADDRVVHRLGQTRIAGAL